MDLQKTLSGLNDAATLIHANNRAKGFWDKDRNIGELLMLVTSELAEALEADRKGIIADTEKYDNFINSGYTWDKNTEELKSIFQRDIKDSFVDELSDAVIRLLDMCGGLGIDIEKHILAKVSYNQTRGNKHGKLY